MHENNASINWYPGHMTKARRMMEENIKLIDLLIELVDARVPAGSRNPDIDRLGQNRSRLILLNKADLADRAKTEQWLTYFRGKGYQAVAVDSRNRKGMQTIEQAVEEACRAKIERDRKRGILNRPVRAMVAGIPNVGKSTFINSLAGKACAKTGNRPGVTKGKQWIRLNRQVELLDTPGILWPRFEDQETGRRLAMIGSINDQILNLEELAAACIRFLTKEYPGALEAKYALPGRTPEDRQDGSALSGPLSEEPRDSYAILEYIGKKRGCVGKGGATDMAKAAGVVLDDFRSGAIGAFTLETPM